MGQYRVTITAVGGHGQYRDLKDVHAQVLPWPENTPEAIIAEAVEKLKATGNSVTEATFHHWPGSGSEVLDNLLTGDRKGAF